MISQYVIEDYIRYIRSITEDIRYDNDGDDRHRYLSLAITHLEEAENWMQRLLNETKEKHDD